MINGYITPYSENVFIGNPKSIFEIIAIDGFFNNLRGGGWKP